MENERVSTLISDLVCLSIDHMDRGDKQVEAIVITRPRLSLQWKAIYVEQEGALLPVRLTRTTVQEQIKISSAG